MAENIDNNSLTIAQNIVENLHAAVIVIDSDLNVVAMNPSAEMLFQSSENRASGHHLSSLIIHEETFLGRIEKTTRSLHPFTVYDTKLTIHNGVTHTVDYVVAPIELDETSTHLLIEFNIVGRGQRIAKENNLLEQHATSRNIIRGLAHEIKNPLGGLRGAAQLLEKKLSDEDREYTHIIISEADRLRLLVDRLLGPKDRPIKADLNIHKVLEHVRNLTLAENDNVEVIADYDPSLPDVYADESMLIQAVLNITRNAISAIKESNIEGKIIFRTRAVRKAAIGPNTYPLVNRIDIIDNGPGIPEDIIEKIFFPMVTNKADGTGLGLSIAQSLIHQHDGVIECRSKTSKTIFTILLPVVNGHE